MYDMLVKISVIVSLCIHFARGAPDVCARYQEPCGERSTGTCCGYPLFDCITDGPVKSCQPMSDYPELYAEVMLRVREAMDRGADRVTLQQLQDSVDALLQNRPSSRSPGRRRGGGGGSRPARPTRPTARRGGRTTRRASTTRRRPNNRNSNGD